MQVKYFHLPTFGKFDLREKEKDPEYGTHYSDIINGSNFQSETDISFPTAGHSEATGKLK